jgi:hypothetical protein
MPSESSIQANNVALCVNACMFIESADVAQYRFTAHVTIYQQYQQINILFICGYTSLINQLII